MTNRMKVKHNTRLAAPMIAKGSRSLQRSAFNEGVQVPQKDFDEIAARKPALKSKDRLERSEAMTKEILTGELKKYRRR